ncbi:MAG: exodeoxyribonuclease V subunit beta, partial [Deltaproteobacteria bacterium]|nr:exodeoxyribonuclease V subunit beta [Deltaproteobacteria bacterium]
MNTIKDFNLINSPLEGTNLIEASAGTGKTYAITGLFLRLLLEKNFSVNEILVVTFTEAATEELKGRIRTGLRKAIVAFSTGKAEDEFLKNLVDKINDPAGALRCLKEAIRMFDEACIYTIHGFCRKMLHENAFESGSLFDTELVTEQEGLKREIVEDFWRRHLYRESSLFVSYVLHTKTNPDNLLSLFGNKTARLEMKIIPELESLDSSDAERQFKKAFDELSNEWPAVKQDVELILMDDKGLKLGQYKKEKIPGWIQGMDFFVASGGNNPVLFDGFQKFCSSELEGAVKKNHTAPDHPFFYVCETLRDRSEELETVFEKRLMRLKIMLFHYLQDELKQRKQQKNIQFFDDLLLNLHKALEGKGSEDLSQNIRGKFKAALIDEFQDTDPIQYAIFKKLFSVKNNILFLIGDPKQAIYGFRGADIFAYMDASKNTKTRYTLKENWRSEPGLISAVNTIFDNSNLPFVYDEIPYHRVSSPAEKKDHELLYIEADSSGAPVQLWFMDAGKITGHTKPITKPDARGIISRAVAAEISRLLALGAEKKAVLGERSLRENDIAVLVRENAEARLMQTALTRLNIPSVIYTSENLFHSHEAIEMARVLAGIAQPNNERLLRVSLATDMIGIRGDQINDLIEHEGEWEKWLVCFREYHRQWDDHGFMRMFKALTREEKILPRLMSYPDGERRSTNLLHLSEVLNQASMEKRLGMTGLVKWLHEMMHAEVQGREEHMLRLESDENAVKLVTIHRSKGLEYPLVFCPFVWGSSRSRDSKGPFMFHDETDNMRLTLDLGSQALQKNCMFAEKETLAENLRLLYVALTRAKNRCYLAWGRINKADTSAPAYLFHQPKTDDRDHIVNVTGARFKALSDKEIYAELEAVCDKAGGTIRLSEMPDEAGVIYSPISRENEKLNFQAFKGKIDHQFRISSFSSLISNQPYIAEVADHDVGGQPDGYDNHGFEESIEREEPSGIFSFPKGARAGTFMHDILEHLDFTEKDASHMEELVEVKLKEYGFEFTWLGTICKMLNNVLSVPLGTNQEDFTLSHIPNRNRLNELGFYFPLKLISPKKLQSIFEKATEAELVTAFVEHMERLTFSPVSGFMKGFMDMVFQFQ